MDCIVHGVAKNWTGLNDFHLTSFFIFKLLLHFMDFLGGSDSKEFACYAGDLGSIHGLRRSPGGGHGNPLQYSCLENPQGQRNLAGYSSWCHKESDTTEQLSTLHFISVQPSDWHKKS